MYTPLPAGEGRKGGGGLGKKERVVFLRGVDTTMYTMTHLIILIELFKNLQELSFLGMLLDS